MNPFIIRNFIKKYQAAFSVACSLYWHNEDLIRIIFSHTGFDDFFIGFKMPERWAFTAFQTSVFHPGPMEKLQRPDAGKARNQANRPPLMMLTKPYKKRENNIGVPPGIFSGSEFTKTSSARRRTV